MGLFNRQTSSLPRQSSRCRSCNDQQILFTDSTSSYEVQKSRLQSRQTRKTTLNKDDRVRLPQELWSIEDWIDCYSCCMDDFARGPHDSTCQIDEYHTHTGSFYKSSVSIINDIISYLARLLQRINEGSLAVAAWSWDLFEGLICFILPNHTSMMRSILIL